MSAATRRRLYPLVARQQGGEYCVYCSRAPIDLAAAGRSSQLCIDHSDNDPSNNDLRNLQLLCHGCNTKKNHPAAARVAAPADRPPGPELAVARRAVPAFRSWLFQIFLDDGSYHYPLADLLDDAAEYLSVSQETVKRYLKRACSPRYGMYATLRPIVGRPYVTLRMDVATGADLRLPPDDEDYFRPPDGDDDTGAAVEADD